MGWARAWDASGPANLRLRAPMLWAKSQPFPLQPFSRRWTRFPGEPRTTHPPPTENFSCWHVDERSADRREDVPGGQDPGVPSSFGSMAVTFGPTAMSSFGPNEPSHMWLGRKHVGQEIKTSCAPLGLKHRVDRAAPLKDGSRPPHLRAPSEGRVG